MPSSKRDRTTGLPIPTPVVPLTDICFRIRIPNALEYRSAFKGVLSELGKAYNWEQTIGIESERANEAAMLWRERIQEAEYLFDCDDVMTCTDVANCITNDASVASALAALIATNEALQQALTSVGGGMQFGNETTFPGLPLTPSQMSGRLNEIDECAFDPYWAQVEQFIDYLLNLGQDTLEQLALYAGLLQSGAATGKMAGLLAKLKNGTTAGKVTEFLNWAATTMKAAYEAADTTANRNAIKCALFCENRDECLITLDGLGATLNERLGGILNPSSITSLTGLAETIVAITFDPSLALDLWLTFMLGTAKTAGILGLEGIDETIQLMLKVAVNDANNDWQTLCDDCPDTYEHCWNFEEETGPFTIIQGTYANGVGYQAQFIQYGNGYTAIALSMETGLEIGVTSAYMEFEYAAGTLGTTGDKTAYFALEGVPIIDVEMPNIPDSPQEGFGNLTGNSIFLQVMPGAVPGAGNPGGSATLKTLCIRGPGIDPFA